MTPALAGKMTVEVILIVIGYGFLVVGVAKLMAWLSRKYPKLTATHEEYYGNSNNPDPANEALDYYPPDDDEIPRAS